MLRNNIQTLELFPIKVWRIQSDIHTESLKDISISLKDSLHYGKSAGGYQGGDSFQNIPEFKEVIDFISDSVKTIFEKDFTFLDMWVSVYGKGDYNNIHNHPPFNSMYYDYPLYSGVFYIETFDNSGQLNIHSDRNVTNKHSLAPQKGELILFNSSTYHSVEPNESDSDRVCFVFNLALNEE